MKINLPTYVTKVESSFDGMQNAYLIKIFFDIGHKFQFPIPAELLVLEPQDDYLESYITHTIQTAYNDLTKKGSLIFDTEELVAGNYMNYGAGKSAAFEALMVSKYTFDGYTNWAPAPKSFQPGTLYYSESSFPQPKIEQKENLGITVSNAMNNLFPVLNETVKCPTCLDSGPLDKIIIGLNDIHKWTREQIADWLESLDLDIEIKEKNVKN